jgi:hypothetical protein
LVAPFTCALEERRETDRDAGLRQAQSSRLAKLGFTLQAMGMTICEEGTPFAGECD